MPLRNRVTPFGAIVATPARGTLMGNRGVLHDAQGQVRVAWRTRAWIACLLEFRGRRRVPMTPGRYTELFFLDEATAFAAGHRPCAECRRADFRAFAAAWAAGNLPAGTAPPSAKLLDERLHAERAPDGSGGRRTFRAPLESLPDGAMIVHPGRPDAALLVRGGELLEWRAEGYGERRPRWTGAVEVLTPASVVAAFAAGYRPALHPSAGAAPTGE